MCRFAYIELRYSIKAAALIRSGEYLIKEIYEQVGFGTSDYFAACFREQFGMTPRQYRKNINNSSTKSIHTAFENKVAEFRLDDSETELENRPVFILSFAY